MDALHDGIMRAAFLKTATDDYYGCGYGGSKHVFGCSGIDGMAIGPDFGSSDNKKYLHAAYGIYSDLNRTDNDYQVILQYSIDEINKYALPLSPGNMHRSGPDRPREKYFIYTGNTYYGIQNLEYDSFTGDYFACVYHGFKPDFPNYTLFVIDGKTAPVMRQLAGNDCSGKTLTLKNIGGGEKGIYGITRYLGDSEFGTLGLYSFGNGNFYAAEPDWNNPDNLSVTVRPFRLKTDASEWNFEEIK